MQGNPLEVTDSRNNVIQVQVFDLLGRPVFTGAADEGYDPSTPSTDKGKTRVLFDAANEPLRTWRSGNLELRRVGDALRRPRELTIDEGSGERLVELTIFGDELIDSADEATVEAGFLKGHPAQVYDTAGLVILTYDFGGRTVEQTREVIDDITVEADWTGLETKDTLADIASWVGTKDERIYVGGYEVWRRRVNGSLDEERQTLHGMDDQRRIAMVETLTVTGGFPVGTPTPRLRYQLDDHLGTATLECDDDGGVISYEEYHPYGTTAWWAEHSSIQVSRKRYRYTGKEKDEETGLYYHGARYYMPWLGRWERADPIGLGDGGNRWAYVGGRPVGLQDPSGLSGFEELVHFAEPVTVILSDPELLRVSLSETRIAVTATGGAGAYGLTSQGLRVAALQGAATLKTGVEGTVAAASTLSAGGLAAAGTVGVAGGVAGYGLLVAADEAATLPLVEGTFSESAKGWSKFLAYAGEHGLGAAVNVALGVDGKPSPESGSELSSGVPGTTGSDEPTASEGAARAELGAAREARVAEITGGRGSGTNRDFEFSETTTRVSRGGKTITEIEGAKVDLLSPTDDHIHVGGPAKANDPNLFKQTALRNQRVARARDQEAHFYFEDTTSPEFLDQVRDWVGAEFVHTFSMR